MISLKNMNSTIQIQIIRILSMLALVLAPFGHFQAQTVLSAGDLAVIGINTGGSGNDAVKLVTFVDLECNTTFVVTDNNWNSSTTSWPCSSGQSEFGIRITVTSRILAGSVFYIDVESSGSVASSTVSTGAMTTTLLGGVWGTNYGLNSGGDNVHILQGNPDERTSPNFIFSLKHGSAYADNNTCNGGGAVNNTGLPSGLTIGTNAVVISTGEDQWHYNCSGEITSGTQAELLASICNESNWTTSSAELIWDNTTCFFNVTDQTPISGILAVTGLGCGCLSNCDLSGMGGPNCDPEVLGNCSVGYQVMSQSITVPEGCEYTVIATMRKWDGCSASGADDSGGDKLKVDILGGAKAFQTGSSNATIYDSYTMTGPGTIEVSGEANRADEIIVYRIIAGETGNTCLTCDVALPITLTDFKANVEGTVVVLEWITASEFNSSHFIVERSQTGSSWEEIGLLPAAGNSTNTIRYKIYDSTPLEGISYYRLREIDNDGKFLLSTIESVYFDNDQKIIKYLNLMGQEVNSNYSGFVFLVFGNGDIKKVYQP
jgi:hypothetical protein